jgi:hypothetical protein
MLYDLEQELQSISLRLDLLAQITGQDSLRVARAHLEKSIVVLNEQLRRGGVYKNGAVVLHLDLNHPDILDFIDMPRNEIPWAKRCIDLSPVMWDMANPVVKEAILKGIARGDIWLAKIKRDQKGERIYANVCLEVFLKSRGTCLLEHINVSACTPEELACCIYCRHGRALCTASNDWC